MTTKETLLNDSLSAFNQKLAGSGEPGGGSAAAYVGALGIALGAMVGELTLGKKKYAAVKTEIESLIELAAALRLKLEAEVDGDVAAFAPLAAAYALPKHTAEEEALREERIQSGLVVAAAGPLQICRLVTEAIGLLERFAQIGSLLPLSDAGVGAAFCQAALQAAQLNVLCNTRLLKDQGQRIELETEANALLVDGLKRCDAILDVVYGRLGVSRS